MRFGLALPHYDFSIPGLGRVEWGMVRDWAQQAEEMGLDSVWVSDHLFLDLAKYGGPPDAQGSLECFTTLAALASTTQRVRLGSLVVCNDLRNPVLLARTAATLAELSSGRFELAMGAGWYEPEYRAAGIPFDDAPVRISRLEEAVQVVKGMFAVTPFSFSGRHYEVEGAVNLPRPEQPPPVWVGGKGDRMVSVAGRFADGYNAVWAWTPEAYAGRIRILEESARRAGRDPSAIRRSVGLYVLPGHDDLEVAGRWDRYRASFPGAGRDTDLGVWSADKLAGTPGEIARRVGEFEALGVEEVILGFGLVPFQIADASAVEMFCLDILPSMREESGLR